MYRSGLLARGLICRLISHLAGPAIAVRGRKLVGERGDIKRELASWQPGRVA